MAEATTMRRVIVESPFRGATDAETAYNVDYARAAVRDCLLRGESPLASHLLYTQDGVLRDDPEERKLGIEAGFAWRQWGHVTAIYKDLGVSEGMKQGIRHAQGMGQTIEFRTLGWKPIGAGQNAQPGETSQ